MSHRLPPLNGLRAFEASARHLSFKIAARELGVTPGAVSQQVKALEQALGVALFRRLPRGLLMTNAGSGYLPELSKAFRIISRSTEMIAPALTGRKLLIGIGDDLRGRLPEGWPRDFAEIQTYIAQPVDSNDPEDVRAGKLDGLLLLQQVHAPGLSNEAVATIVTGDDRQNIYFVCSVGLAGCRQSRALANGLSAIFLPVV